MSILASLVRAYGRLPDAPPFGYSMEKIGFIIGLNEDGSVASVTDLRDGTGKKKQPPMLLVPQPVKRTAGIAPNFLWDKTSYVLGVTAGEGKRTADEHAAFVKRHVEALEGTQDAGLRALLLFLKNWSPEYLLPPEWSEDLKDQNAVFALESERRQQLLHEREAAEQLWEKQSSAADKSAKICLVTGETGPVARLHPSVKGVWGAQSSGAALVSFNLDAFASYGHKQGSNAPISELAAAKYTTVLNHFLERDSSHRVQIGDTSTVFWADASNVEAANAAESFFAALIDDNDKAADEEATKTIGIQIERIRRGDSLSEVEPKLADKVDFYVLGLAPNAARLSIRFFYEGSFQTLTRRYQRFVSEMRVEPPPRDDYPPLWRYLVELAVLRKRENVPPNLAGDWMRSILAGTNYPLTLLSTTLMRIRADGEVNALRTGILKAVLMRNYKMEVPVALDPEERNKGYLLGRLFAVYEEIQRAALGNNVNATIKDKFYASASATPRKVFSMLDAGSANHLSKIGKQSKGRQINLVRLQEEIMDLMEPGKDPYPSSFSANEQALFGLGYHHQHSEFFKSRKTADTTETGDNA
ncbi:type I-C CRISPR-associated protein Cas8c/Csd1 [Falsochrobactrum shanghaiense]|uniref:Type I-C CRISPR-associated protein Cas8c/Csd1 n=1 Tax=Falsochrobactrum shanghaiense TaxID=2201899 RepID=A0A316JC29_9HYPH|nr:type I-C CRISPR-associated protein Cas8c/Csd1 [Falsochrobactrum shanghaiense]PWL18926.1 type I-C CRISPR-associated protein Cas8c/Csd1 [Falsochrobactrum shanghaiense]